MKKKDKELKSRDMFWVIPPRNTIRYYVILDTRSEIFLPTGNGYVSKSEIIRVLL